MIEPPCHEIVWKRTGSTRLRRMRFDGYQDAESFYLATIASGNTRWAAWNEISVRRAFRAPDDEATP